MNLLRSLRALTSRLPTDPRAVELRHRLRALRSDSPRGDSTRILIQCVEDPYYLGLFAHLSRALRAQTAAKVDLFVPSSFNVRIGASWKAFFWRTFPVSRLLANQWVRMYDVVSTHVGYRSTSLRHPLGDLIDAWRSWRVWRSTTAVSAFEALRIGGIQCGDLILDSYLRFRPSPRIHLDDGFVLYLLWQAHRDVRRARRYFRSERPQLYLASYTTYIQHGVAARVALQEGTRVVSFGNFQEFGKLLSVDDSFHTRHPVNYRRDFDRLPNGEALFDEARRQLELRLSGSIDSATSYMGASAYKATTDAVPDVRDAVVIFLHDFYDSPHVYADMVFADFWDWICFTIETLQATSIKFLVKPHPNQIALSDSVIEELKQRFPGLELISPAVTNRQLVDAGMACAVTVYGTIAHEMAYLGVPSIGCARHPHVAFDFCATARDRAGYADLLRRALHLPHDEADMRRQALQFYVMHNLAAPHDQLTLRNAMTRAWRACHDGSTAGEMAAAFEFLASLPGFSRFVASLLECEADEASAITSSHPRSIPT